MNQLVNETLSVSGSLLVKLFAREKREMERFDTVNDEVINTDNTKGRVALREGI